MAEAGQCLNPPASRSSGRLSNGGDGTKMSHPSRGGSASNARNSRDYGSLVIRFCGPGATGEFAIRYATNASRSIIPVSWSVPAVSVVNPSPPPARKLLTVTRYEAVGSIGTPLIMIALTLLPTGAEALHE